MQRFLGAGERSVRFEVLFPGFYEVFAATFIDGQEQRWSETLAVEVAPGASASVTLELRQP